MAIVTVRPEEFTLVFFDRARIVEVATETADRAGLPADFAVHIDVDESSPLGRSDLVALTPPGSGDGGSVELRIEGGAFENAKRPRHLSDDAVSSSLGRLFFRVKDRISPGFADVPPDDDLDLRRQTAWDAYAVGRAARAGLVTQKARRLYHFRNRHGFSDVADRAFETLWNADDLTWADIDAICATTQAAAAAGTATPAEL
jgi:hypothetical protein